jgi:4-amino-4-deoxy-L-arabinose transferase-like glycosyltransferase
VDASPSDAIAAESTSFERSSSRRATTASAVLVVVAAWAVLELWGLGAAPFHTKGEPREALVVWEMTHGGGWILPKRNGTELPSKPPLFHWLGAAASLVRGATDEWSIRFPSALLSLFGVFGVLAAGTALWGPLAGLVAALSLMTTFEWARAATNARVDMTLTVGMEAAFLGFLFFLRTRRVGFLLLLYSGIAFAALGKGPVGIVLPGAAALTTIVAARELGLLREMRLLRGALFVAVAAGSWYALALQLGGADFFRKQVLNENLFRFLGGERFSGGHRHSNLELFGLLLLGLLPWTLFLPHTVVALWGRRREISFRGGEIYCLVWIAVVCGFYALVASKRSVYLLAMYPAAALLLGWWWQAAIAKGGWRSAVPRLVGFAAAAIAAAVLIVVVMQLLGLPAVDGIGALLSPRDRANLDSVSRAIAADWLTTLVCLGIAVAATLLFDQASARGYLRAAFGFLFAAAAAVIVVVRLVILPGIAEGATLRRFMAEVRAAVGPADAPFFYRTFDYGAVFYREGHIPTYAGTFPDGAPRFLLMSASEWERLRPQVVHDYEQVRLPSDPRRLVLVRRIRE